MNYEDQQKLRCMRKRFRSRLIIVLAPLFCFPVQLGCKHVDCGRYFSPFGFTRADWTPPPVKPSTNPSPPQPESPQGLNNSHDGTAKKSNQVVSTIKGGIAKMSPFRLAGYEHSMNKPIAPEVVEEMKLSDPLPAVEIENPSDMSVVSAANPIINAGPDELLAQNTQFPSNVGGNLPGNMRTFDLPKDFPGGATPPLRLPRMDGGTTSKERQSIVDQLFLSLPKPQSAALPFDSDGREITLSELQDLALANNPTLQQAIARVDVARGRMIQAGLYPNPTFGYEGDTIGTANTAGYNGGFLTQQFITANKLGLAQSALLMEMRASEFELRSTRIEVATNVRNGYFRILVAQEKIRMYEAIQRLSNEVYEAQRTLVAGGESAVYEPLQLRVLAVIASNNVLSARNDLSTSWRQLTASVGVPELPASRVYGNIELQVPQVSLEQAIEMMMARNADLNAAQARITGNQFNVRLQQVTPIPDVLVYSAIQRDDTSSLTPNRTSFNLQASIPVPVFNRNQGNITAARATLVDADRNYNTVRNRLLGDLANAYNRYITQQAIVNNYREVIIPDQVRVYRATYERFRIAGQEVDFAQIVVTQQTLATAVISYLDAVSNQWIAAVDLARLIQVDDLFTFDLTEAVAAGIVANEAEEVVVER